MVFLSKSIVAISQCIVYNTVTLKYPGLIMAVQKSKKSRSRSKMRRANVHFQPDAMTVDTFTGEVHRRHHVTDQGYYKGKQVILPKEKKDKDDEE